MKSGKKIIIIAGPNGAGKTTYAREYLLNEADCPIFVNADQIAAGIAPEAPEAAAVQAGRLMLEKIDALVAEGASFALETTLSGRGYVRKIAKWRADGYHVALHFLSLQTPEDAIERVASRVRLGGHNIPPDVIRRRFHAGLENLRKIYAQCVDSWQLYDNNRGQLKLLESGVNHEIS
ncbi:MAG: Zeta toxin family protein [Arenicellales bacterium IbO2]|nr:zeta toxin family protein [Gammaproteobacteria bacterium]MDA8022155.1 zeta toxin family protein [Gammaproteobacteria bacterium]MDA8022998.1 zeta toxin family protein [Gammaproteobacteria bacterium]CAJ2377109.1 MAG: Zeta toxin family protein [Arenicellales bacterium IbO2]